MAANEIVVGTLAEFIDVVTSFRDKWFPSEPTWAPWFRGHRSVRWDLKPTFYRHFPFSQSTRKLDDELRQEFTMRAPGLGLGVRPKNSWEWYFLMQHSGAPTRLLDWTEGSLIGLYFAVRDNKGNEDAAVWMLEPWRLNKQVAGHSEVVPPGDEQDMSESDAKRYAPWLPRRFDSQSSLPLLPVQHLRFHLEN
jgi:hypothetical protein